MSKAQLAKVSQLRTDCATQVLPERLPATMEFALQQAHWLNKCSPEVRDLIREKGRLRRARRGEVLIRRGEVTQQMAMVVTGALRANVAPPDACQQVMTFFGPGEIANVIGAMDGQASLYEFSAHVDSTVLWLSRPTIEAISASDITFLQAILRHITARARKIHAFLNDATLRSVRERCIHALLRLESQFGVTHELGVAIDLRISQEEFASLVAGARPTVNRILVSLANDGIIALSYASIVVVDLDRLRGLASSSH